MAPGDYWSSVHLAMLYFDGQDYEKAGNVLSVATGYYDQDALLHQLTGNVHLLQDEFEKALDEYEFSIKVAPFNPAGYVGKALYFSAIGDKKDSLDELENALELGYREFDRIESLSVFQETADSRKYRRLKKKFTKQ